MSNENWNRITAEVNDLAHELYDVATDNFSPNDALTALALAAGSVVACSANADSERAALEIAGRFAGVLQIATVEAYRRIAAHTH